MDVASADALACVAFAMRHRARPRSTSPRERPSREVTRRAGVAGLLPSEGSIARLVGAVLLGAGDDRPLQHRTMQIEDMAELDAPQPQKGSALQITPAAV